MGVVVQFPGCGGRLFTARMRDVLVRLAETTPGLHPLSFGKDHDGSEVCRLGNGLSVGWDRRRLVLTDTVTGYVDRGPFESLDEICLLIACLR